MLSRREANEVIALDVYHRAGGALIDLIEINKRIRRLLRHARCCDCGLCECAVTAQPSEVLRVISGWREPARWQPGTSGDRIRELRARGAKLHEIADEVGCSVGTVRSRLA